MKNELVRDWRKRWTGNPPQAGGGGQAPPQPSNQTESPSAATQPPPSDSPKPAEPQKKGGSQKKQKAQKNKSTMSNRAIKKFLANPSATNQTMSTENIPKTQMPVRQQKYEVNLGRAPSVTSLLDKQDPDRRLATTFGLIVAKAAEDLSGAPKPGDDFWDFDQLMARRITHKELAKCKMTRERERIILLLDTSPSCARMAKFYQKLAQIAMLRDDIEVYNAPNGCIENQYLPGGKEVKPRQLLEQHAVYLRINEMGWRRRTIMYFSDFDGTDQNIETSKYNRFYWMYARYAGTAETQWVYERGFRGKFFPQVENAEDLLDVARRLRGVGG